MIKVNEQAFKEAINRVAASDDGRIVLAAIKHICKWDETFVASGDPVQTHYFAAMRGLYGGLRKHIRKEHLKEIEFEYQLTKEGGDDNGTDSTDGNGTVKRSDRK